MIFEKDHDKTTYEKVETKELGILISMKKIMQEPARKVLLTDSVDDMTERLLVDAGIGPGMSVLDVGCGSGDVSFLLAKLVGKKGHVTGIDWHNPSLEIARERVRKLHLLNITFTQVDVCTLSPEFGPFDAAVSRRVIMYLPEPVNAIRKIAATLRPDGVVALLEHDATMVPGRVKASAAPRAGKRLDPEDRRKRRRQHSHRVLSSTDPKTGWAHRRTCTC